MLNICLLSVQKIKSSKTGTGLSLFGRIVSPLGQLCAAIHPIAIDLKHQHFFDSYDPQLMSVNDSAVYYGGGLAGPSHCSYKTASFHFWTSILDVIDIAGFLTPYIFHPVQGFHTYFPTMGATTFDPERSIGDLAGKVILVTGGVSPLLKLGCFPTKNHIDDYRQQWIGKRNRATIGQAQPFKDIHFLSKRVERFGGHQVH